VVHQPVQHLQAGTHKAGILAGSAAHDAWLCY
jgi:hypothetical protein